MKCKVVNELVKSVRSIKDYNELLLYIDKNKEIIIDPSANCVWGEKKRNVEEIEGYIKKIKVSSNPIDDLKSVVYYSILLKLNSLLSNKIENTSSYLNGLMSINIENESIKTIISCILVKFKSDIDFLNDELLSYKIKKTKVWLYNKVFQILKERHQFKSENIDLIDGYINDYMNIDYPELSILSQLRLLDPTNIYSHYKNIYEVCNTEYYKELMETNRGISMLLNSSKQFLSLKD